jgi:hypothetical protein
MIKISRTTKKNECELTETGAYVTIETPAGRVYVRRYDGRTEVYLILPDSDFFFQQQSTGGDAKRKHVTMRHKGSRAIISDHVCIGPGCVYCLKRREVEKTK